MPLSQGSLHIWKQEWTVRHLAKIARQGTPSTAAAQEIEDGAKDIVQVHFARCRAFTGTFQKREKGRIVCN